VLKISWVQKYKNPLSVIKDTEKGELGDPARLSAPQVAGRQWAMRTNKAKKCPVRRIIIFIVHNSTAARLFKLFLMNMYAIID
jgi:hypothetical protein